MKDLKNEYRNLNHPESRSDMPMVAVGFNPRVRIPQFPRRVVTPWLAIGNRGLKPTAIGETSLRDFVLTYSLPKAPTKR